MGLSLGQEEVKKERVNQGWVLCGWEAGGPWDGWGCWGVREGAWVTWWAPLRCVVCEGQVEGAGAGESLWKL